MADNKPLYLEKAEELIGELSKLTPVLKQHVEKAKREGRELSPNVERCLRSASVLKTLITDMEEEISEHLDADD